MKVRNNGRIVFPKGVELDRDIQPGEVTAVKQGLEQSERVVNALQSGSLIAITVDNMKTEAGTVAIQPGDTSPLSEFGEALPLPKRVVEQQRKHEEWAKQQEQEVIEPSEDLVGEVSTSKLLTDEHLTTLLNDPKIETEEPAIDELAEFQRRNGGARAKYVQQMTDVKALRTALGLLKGGKTRAAIEARIGELCNQPEQFN